MKMITKYHTAIKTLTIIINIQKINKINLKE